MPEFDENSALDDPQASPLEQMDERSEIDEQVAIDNVTRQLQQAATKQQSNVSQQRLIMRVPMLSLITRRLILRVI